MPQDQNSNLQRIFDEYKNDEAIKIPWKTGGLAVACCCCGLVHQHGYEVIGDTIVVRINRDEELTERHRKQVGLSIHLEDENVRTR